MQILTRRATHAQRLEHWLGAEVCENLVASMRDWYGPPIALAHVPGNVSISKGGDFRGWIDAGQDATLRDYLESYTRRNAVKLWRRFDRWAKQQARKDQVNAGFTSLSDLIAEATAGKSRMFLFQKVGTTGVAGATNTLWFVGNQPAAGAAAAAAPGGTVPTSATTGTFAFDNVSPDTRHVTGAHILSTVAGNQLLLYDRLFSVTKTMNSTATEAVTGVPTRYQSTTAANKDYIGGNFLFFECRTVLPATAHNWTTCLYTDQANASSTLPSLTGNSGNIVNRIDHPTGQWFAPLASGDVGVKAITQLQLSSSLGSGAVDATIGHPLAFIPCPLANILIPMDGINSAFNLERVYDDACMAFLEIIKSATTATTYTGTFNTVSG